MNILQTVSPFSSSDYWIAVIAIIFGLFMVIYQFISWFKWELIVKFGIWWNKYIYDAHKDPYQGPSETSRTVANFFGIFILLFGLAFIALGVSIFILGSQ